MIIKCWDNFKMGVEHNYDGKGNDRHFDDTPHKIYRVPRLIGLIMIPFLRTIWDNIEFEC